MSVDLNSDANTERLPGDIDYRREVVHDEAKVFVSSLCLLGLVLLVTACILQASEYREMTKPLALIPMIFIDSVSFYFKWYFLLFVCQKSVLLEVLTLFFDLCVWITIFLSFTKINFSILFCMIPIGLSIVTSALLYQDDSSALKVFKKYKIIFKCFGLLAVLFIGLKTENLINPSWILVIWPIWVGLLALALKSLSILAYLTGVVAYSEIFNPNNHKISSIWWTLYSTLGCAISCSISLFLIKKSHFNLSYLPVIIFLTLFELLSLLLFKQIVEFITDCFFVPGPSQNQEINDPSFDNINERLENYENSSWNKHFKFIKRVNSIYFRPVIESVSMEIDEVESTEHAKTKSCEVVLTSDSYQEEQCKNSEKNCLICLDLPKNAIIIPCGHGGICSECADKLSKTKKSCHICRGKILKIFEIQSIKSNFTRVKGIIT